jgi:hypothetical protein
MTYFVLGVVDGATIALIVVHLLGVWRDTSWRR